MNGFEIITKTEKGEELLLQDLNVNKKVFEMVTVKTKPFLNIKFLLKKRTPQGNLMRRAFSVVPPDQLKKHFASKLISLGAKQGKDFEVVVLE